MKRTSTRKACARFHHVPPRPAVLNIAFRDGVATATESSFDDEYNGFIRLGIFGVNFVNTVPTD